MTFSIVGLGDLTGKGDTYYLAYKSKKEQPNKMTKGLPLRKELLPNNYIARTTIAPRLTWTLALVIAYMPLKAYLSI